MYKRLLLYFLIPFFGFTKVYCQAGGYDYTSYLKNASDTLTRYLNHYSFPPDKYNTLENRYYWKNRPPFPGYWQQDVHYKMIAVLNDSLDIIDGVETLDYYNNSPDTLKEAFFHLYSNAQNKDSYYSNLYQTNKQPLTFGKYEKQDSGCYVKSISSGNTELKAEVDNTVMKVKLSTPLPPGGKATFHITFRTYFDSKGARNRMKMFIADKTHNFKQYDVVHWYPRICVYDTKFGWDVEQHLAHEFYGDFGTYDVAFILPNNYVVGATGNLWNEEQVLPDTLLKKLDIRNFSHHKWDSAATVIIPKTSSAKAWVFHAENVHDFALTADPTYRIGLTNWMGVQCIALAEEMHAARWQNAASYTAKIIATDSKYFGMYGYPKIIVADARDGMEYPMLTLDGGGDPDYRTLLAHEVSHNWFFGMVGSNETYRAALDEGFTQFAESWISGKIDGPYGVYGAAPKNAPRMKNQSLASRYVQEYYKPELLSMSTVYDGYLWNNLSGIGDFTENNYGKAFAARTSASLGFKDVTLNTQSDNFSSALGHDGGYGQVYFKTATMLYNLQYVLGDSLFFKAMQHYFNQWKFCHPYLNDFRNSITQYVHTDMTWFFDEWLNTSKTIDYSVSKVKKSKVKDQYIITFKRKGDMQMPVDFTVTNKKDSTFSYYIPNSWFEKKTNAIILPRWIGWGKVEPTYTATVIVPNGLSKVEIDTTHRLADINMLNNSKPFPVKLNFDSKLYNSPDWNNYEMFIGPSVWYDSYDGLQLGAHTHGDYMLFQQNINATVLFNTELFRNYSQNFPNINQNQIISFALGYQTPLDKCIKNSSVSVYAQSLDGLDEGKLTFQLKDNSLKNTFYTQLKAMYRPNAWDSNYLLYPHSFDEYNGASIPGWESKKFNNSITVGMKRDYRYPSGGKGSLDIKFKSSILTNDYDFNQTTLTWLNNQPILKKLLLKTRFFAQYGGGDNVPSESALYLAGANPEEMTDNPFTRASGFVPSDWLGYGNDENHFQEGGGLNLRGYAGMFNLTADSHGNYYYAFEGNSGASVSAELEFNKLVHYNPAFLKNTLALSTYLFGDMGTINFAYPTTLDLPLQFTYLMADAGVGVALTIQRWGPLEYIKPLTIRFDMPLLINRLPYGDTQFFQYRWVLGIGRTF